MVSVSRGGYSCGEYVGESAAGGNTQTPDSVSAPTTLWRGSKTGVSSAYSRLRPKPGPRSLQPAPGFTRASYISWQQSPSS